MAETLKILQPPWERHALTHRQGEETVLLGYGRTRVGKRKTKVAPASVIEKYLL